MGDAPEHKLSSGEEEVHVHYFESRSIPDFDEDNVDISLEGYDGGELVVEPTPVESASAHPEITSAPELDELQERGIFEVSIKHKAISNFTHGFVHGIESVGKAIHSALIKAGDGDGNW